MQKLILTFLILSNVIALIYVYACLFYNLKERYKITYDNYLIVKRSIIIIKDVVLYFM